MEKYTLYIGLNDKITKLQKVSTFEAQKVVMNIVENFTEGGTIFEAQGFYTHESGVRVREATLRLELLFTDEKAVKNIVEAVKLSLNQESIAVQKEVIHSELW